MIGVQRVAKISDALEIGQNGWPYPRTGRVSSPGMGRSSPILGLVRVRPLWDRQAMAMTRPLNTPGEANAFAGLRAGFQGAVLEPGDAGYDDARRIWNGAIDRRPACVARCAGVADVVAAVRFARERDLRVAVRGGGHGVAGHAVCDGGLVIDLSAMTGIRVDPRTRSARAEGGVLWGELDRATQRFGLATVGGIVTHTGVAGLTLGGGLGWLMRKHGATVDNVLSVGLVTADGELLTASAAEHEELFWGIRGAGANFGIVNEFEYRLHPVGPSVLAGPIFYALEDAPEVLRGYRDVVAAAPDELTTIVNLRLAPALPSLPVEVHGKPIVMVGACYAGPPEDGAGVVAPLRELARPIADRLEPKPYLELQSMFDPFVPHGWHYHWKSLELPPLTDAAIDTLVEHAAAMTSPRSYCIVFQLGGALGRVDAQATAFAQRGATHNVNINAVWTPEDRDAELHIAWARAFFDAMQPHARGGVYVNFLGDEGPDRVRAAYGPANHDRLLALKRAYDPTNFLRLNHNIDPTGS
jgi:FAD/FMN-containing dehydrogenase